MRDAEQPGLERTRIVERVELAIRLEERLLDNVFAVDHRSRHPCAVTMQTRTEVGNRFEKRKIAGLERASGGRSFWTLHIDHYAAKPALGYDAPADALHSRLLSINRAGSTSVDAASLLVEPI